MTRTTTSERLSRAKLSLEGLSIGDAFGETFFAPPPVFAERIARRELAPGPWSWTDDTAMALSIVEVLERCGRVDADALAEAFARRYVAQPARGYGRAAHEILSSISRGTAWRQAATSVFSGLGSKGNGGGMRAGPVGAFFAGDPDRVVEEAARSACVTHAHPEGQAGAIAVALAAAWAVDNRDRDDGEGLLEFVTARLETGPTRDGLVKAIGLPPDSPVVEAAEILGCGRRVLAEDTVPLALWVAARHLKHYEEALWTTVSAGGDIDTNAAIVGSIVILSAPRETVPGLWAETREPLPAP